jgi:PAS domain S-box-containing protein
LVRQAVGTVERVFVSAERRAAERRTHEAEHHRADAIVESIDDAIVSLTLDGIITTWNPAAQRLLGYSAAEIIGSSVEILIPADRAGEEPMIRRRIRASERIQEFETIRVHKDGRLIPVAITFSPTRRPDETTPGSTTIVGVSKIIRDITAQKKAEETSEQEKRFARSLIEAMPGIFYLHDEQGRLLRWNRNFARVSGYSAEEIGSMQPLDFFADADKENFRQLSADAFAIGEASFEASLIAKDGSATPYCFTGKRMVLDEVTCIGGVGVDISELKRSEADLSKSEARYRTTLDIILESCQLLDFDWRYLYLNGAAADQNRRPNVELLGNRMPEVWPGIEATPTFALLDRCMRERVRVHGETEFTFADGTKRWFDIRAQPVLEGIFVLSIDISERKEAERALWLLNQSLERKVEERTVDLDAARARAEAADQLKSAFLATMSHELRTPLNSIIGFTGILLQGLAGALNPEQSKQLGMVQGSARHLLDLINDVLDLSKIEVGQLAIKSAPFDLRASVDRVTASVTPFADKKGLALRIVAPARLVPMQSDRRRVEQILLNLLNNGIKFTDRGEVTLSIELVDDARLPGSGGPQAAARIVVTDSGIGMHEQDLSKLFQPFRQIDSGLQRQHEGTGLGLAICRRLTDLLGGTIGARSVWGEGSVFTVDLPMKRT